MPRPSCDRDSTRRGWKLRAFHTTVGAPKLAGNSNRGAGLFGGLGYGGADWIAESYAADDTLAKKRGDAVEGAVEELIGDDKVGGLVLFLKRTDGRQRENALHSELFEGVDVGSEVEFGREDAMTTAVREGRQPCGPPTPPSTKASDGAAKGASTCTSWTFVNPGIE